MKKLDEYSPMFDRLIGKVKDHTERHQRTAAQQQEIDQETAHLVGHLKDVGVNLNDRRTAEVTLAVTEILLAERQRVQDEIEAQGQSADEATMGSLIYTVLGIQHIAENVVYRHGQDVPAKCTFCE